MYSGREIGKKYKLKIPQQKTDTEEIFHVNFIICSFLVIRQLWLGDLTALLGINNENNFGKGKF